MIAAIVVFSVIAFLIGLSALLGFIRSKTSAPEPPFVPADVPIQEIRASQEGWPHRCLVALDVFVNVVVLRGQPDETISAHSWRASLDGKLWGRLMCRWLDGFQDQHGPKAASGDLQRAKSRVVQLSKLLGVGD